MRRLALLLSVLLLAPSASFAQDATLTPITNRDDAVAYLALYAGDWAARGQSRSNFDDPLEDAGCSMSTVFDAESATLENTGRCANTLRAIRIDGTLTITPEGTLTGGYFGRFEQAELLSSDGQLYEDRFIVEARYRAQIKGAEQEISVKVTVGRPTLRDDGRTAFGLIVEVIDPDTNEYVEFSSFTFTRNLDN
jgi:hypothetical protein